MKNLFTLKPLWRNLVAVTAVTLATPAFAQARFELPQNYETLKGCVKQEILWKQALATRYKEKLPDFEEFGLKQILKLGVQSIIKKKTCEDDIAPKNWKKYLHRRGIVAQAKIVPLKKNGISGVFNGSPCALLRLSLTFRPDNEKRNVAPGLALKVLRDGVISGNVSALYTLAGQGKDNNFFKNPLSNIVPRGSGFGASFVHEIFFKVTDYPEQLMVRDLFAIDSKGKRWSQPSRYRQIFFVPNPELKNLFETKAIAAVKNLAAAKSQAMTQGSSSENLPDIPDVRLDILRIAKGTRLYTVKALPMDYFRKPYSKYTADQISDFVTASEPIAEIVSTSSFVASSFGDDELFFRHEIRPKTIAPDRD